MTLTRRPGIVTPGISLLVVGLAFGLGACRGEEGHPAPSRGTVPQAPVTDSATAVATADRWDDAAGPALVLAFGTTGDSAMVVRPEYVDDQYDGWRLEDVRPFAHSRWDLFGRGGFFGSAQLEPGTKPPSSDECATWPPATISVSKSGWRVALATGHATAVPLDSVKVMSRSDSSRFVVEVTRLAASTHGSDDSLFASIPFVVNNAYLFRTGDIEGLIASVQRSIHSEANPREEHLFLIAERPVGSSNPYHVAYTTRNAGLEGNATITDVLAVVSLSANRRLVLIASHESEDGGAIWWIERIAPGRWGATWRSVTIGC